MYSGARSFFRFMEEEAWEGTGRRSPMAGIQCPKVEARPVDHLQPEEMRALLTACKGSRRDEAIVSPQPASRRCRLRPVCFYLPARAPYPTTQIATRAHLTRWCLAHETGAGCLAVC
jgi:integrase